MKLALAGKGGSGKTALTTLLALVLAARGRQVLAADLDSNPGLAVSLGIGALDWALPAGAVQERADTAYGWGLAEGIAPAQAAARFATPVRDGISFLGLGNVARVDKAVKRSVTAVLEMLHAVDEHDMIVLADLEAGITTVYEGYAMFATPWIVVSEPTPASTLAAGRIRRIADHEGIPTLVVANKVRGPRDIAHVEEALGPLAAAVPFDPEVRAREAVGALAGIGAGGPAWRAVSGLVDAISPVAAGQAGSVTP